MNTDKYTPNTQSDTPLNIGAVMPCLTDEQLEKVNKYARHQYNRGQLDLQLIPFEEWVNKA